MQGLDGGQDDLGIFLADRAAVAGMRIEAGDAIRGFVTPARRMVATPSRVASTIAGS